MYVHGRQCMCISCSTAQGPGPPMWALSVVAMRPCGQRGLRHWHWLWFSRLLSIDVTRRLNRSIYINGCNRTRRARDNETSGLEIRANMAIAGVAQRWHGRFHFHRGKAWTQAWTQAARVHGRALP